MSVYNALVLKNVLRKLLHFLQAHNLLMLFKDALGYLTHDVFLLFKSAGATGVDSSIFAFLGNLEMECAGEKFGVCGHVLHIEFFLSCGQIK